VQLVKYHAWANQRILDAAQHLSDQDFHRPASLDHGTAFQTLRHLADVNWSWREFCSGHDPGETYAWDLFPLDDLKTIRAFIAEEDVRLREYVEGLDQATLAERLGTKSFPRWLLIAHVVNHGTQHRSELARYLTELGHSPGDMDLIDAVDSP
jgi:uncharacterized damage-inducible protein DinB